MKTISYWTTHSIKAPAFWMNLLRLDNNSFRLSYDEISPQWLFVTESIYSRPEEFLYYVKKMKAGVVSVYFALEAIFPDMNLFDYAIVHDTGCMLGDRIGRVPILFFDDKFAFLRGDRGELKDIPEWKKRFCSFIYSNSQAHPHRDWLFHTLSKGYKRVDSLGAHLNNTGTRSSRTNADWRNLSVELKRPYKFDISAENARYPGYTSEKIFSAFQARCVPIYWGNPEVVNELNPKAFVNANGCNETSLIDTIRRIDENTSLWLAMINEPPLTSTQMDRARQDLEIYQKFTDHIFRQPIADAIRRPEGTWVDVYTTAWKQRSLTARLRLYSNPLRQFAANCQRTIG